MRAYLGDRALLRGTTKPAKLLYAPHPLFPETVLVVQSVGIQVVKENRLGVKSSYFLPFTIVKDVVINESISKVSVL